MHKLVQQNNFIILSLFNMSSDLWLCTRVITVIISLDWITAECGLIEGQMPPVSLTKLYSLQGHIMCSIQQTLIH